VFRGKLADGCLALGIGAADLGGDGGGQGGGGHGRSSVDGGRRGRKRRGWWWSGRKGAQARSEGAPAGLRGRPGLRDGGRASRAVLGAPAAAGGQNGISSSAGSAAAG
jgi:hypothetical protein